MRKYIFLTMVIFIAINAWLYQTNYFSWQSKLSQVWYFISHLDDELLDNKSLALRQARAVVDEVLATTNNVSSGPCLKEELISNWSLDLVHEPRNEIDDDVLNQCQYFLSGKTKRLIEFDIDGNFIGIKNKN